MSFKGIDKALENSYIMRTENGLIVRRGVRVA